MPNELDKNDIDAYIKYLCRRPDERIKNVFELIAERIKKPFELRATDVDLGKDLEFDHIYYDDDQKREKDGCKGIHMFFSEKNDTRWITFAIYYNTGDHGIPFRAGCPELAFFVDINPEKDPMARVTLKKNERFLEALKNLVKLGWEENLTRNPPLNEYRLLWWRKPLIELQEITPDSLTKILSIRLDELASEPEFYKAYLAQAESDLVDIMADS